MKVYIKNMVCGRCVSAVQEQFQKLHLPVSHVSMGEVDIKRELTEYEKKKLSEALMKLGFEILNDKKTMQIEQVKKLLIKVVQGEAIEEHFSISQYLSKQLHKEYSNISRLFSEVEGITIEQFFIQLKIEKVKELLKYDELTLSEIAWKLSYSSVAHLSAQFKKVTGLAPGAFKKSNIIRKPLDKL